MKNRKILSIQLLLMLLLSVSALAVAQNALPGGGKKITSVEGITEYQLDNGLRVLLFPDQSKQTITVNITYQVGSRNENYGETGMAHLLEHLVFKGTPNHPNIPEELTAHGARPNGTTWYDRTNYYETFQATDENLKWALDLEADRMVNSYIAKKDLDSEMTVVRNEFESGENSPSRVLLERTLSTMFIWHNYGKSTIGSRADLENVPIDRLQAFYRNYYQPDNAVLLVAGKFDEAKTLNWIAEYFGKIPRPTRVIQKTYTLDPVQDGERTVTVRRTGDVQMVMNAYHIPAGAHPDYAVIEVLGFLLADEPSGRLYKALVESKKATSVFNFSLALREPGFLLCGAEVRQEASLDAAREAMVSTMENFAAPTSEEIERAKTALLKQIDLLLNASDRVGLEMSEWIAAGDWRLFFLHRDRIKSVTPDDIKRVAGAYLKPANRSIGLFIPTAKPERAEIPATPDVMALVKDYKGNAVVAAGEIFDPSPTNIESRTMRATAANGLKLAFVPKKTRGNTVIASMTVRMGNEKSLMNRGTAGEFAGQMLMRGTTKHTRQQLQDEIDKLKARAFAFGGTTSAGISIETTRENLPAVMALMAEVLREPVFPTDEFEKLRQEQLAGIEQQRSEPQSIAATAFQRHINPYPKSDPRYVETPDESIAAIKAVTLEEVKKFHADFYGANVGELTVIGDFDDKSLAKQVETLFTGWKSKISFERLTSNYRDIAAVNQSFEAPDKANAFFIAGQNLNVRDDDPDYPALVLGNYMLGGGFLNSRLATRIRQKDGLSYGVGSQLSASSLDKTGSFVSFAIYAPQNAAKLETAFKEEIARMLKDGFTAEEVKAAKSGWLQSRQVSRAQDRELAGRLNSYLYLGRTLAWDADFEKKVSDLTPEQIVAAFRKHLDPNKITVMKAGDFAKAAANPATSNK
jgi:zinc protease